MTFTLRICTLSDVPALEELIPLSVRALQADHYSAEQMAGALGAVFGVDTQLIADGTYFAAEAEGVLVGCGGWSRRQTQFGADQSKTGVDRELNPQTDAARIRAFFVHPQWARRGIGSALIRECEAAAKRAGFRRIDIVATLPGEQLYARHAYRATERFDVPLANGHRLPVVRMTKAIVS